MGVIFSTNNITDKDLLQKRCDKKVIKQNGNDIM